MSTRIVTKIGDVFCIEIDNEYKRYFQYVVSDMEQLNSSVIRVFKTCYPMDYVPDVQNIVHDETDFYTHTVLRAGITTNSWYKVGNDNYLGNYQEALFRTCRDANGPDVEVSEQWDVWRVNEPSVYVGKLPEKYFHAERGSVMPYVAIIDRLRYGKCTYKYPGY